MDRGAVDRRTKGKVAGIVLAAGSGERLEGEFKLLLPCDGGTVVAAAVDAALAAGLAPVVAVLGHRSEDVRRALSGREVRTVLNPDHRRGQATSLARGVRAVRADPDVAAAAVLLGDEPGLRPGVVRRASAAWRRGDADVVRCVYRDRPGHPVIFDRACFDDLERLTGDAGARVYLERQRERVRELSVDRRAPVDVDTRADYRRLRDGAD